MQGVSEGHLPVAMVMAIGFAVGGDVDQLILGPVIDEGVQEPVGQAFPGAEQVLEGDRLRGRRVVEEDGQPTAFGELNEIRGFGIDQAAGHVFPIAAADRPDAFGLVR